MYEQLQATFRPIDKWPGQPTPPGRRKRAPFRATWSRTASQLARELRHLGARNIVIQLALTEREIRIDGWPRADARPQHSGVILSFESKHGPLNYPCDTFNDWQSNLRAIALALESLRRVDRYGVTRHGEQYRGWKKLPGPEPVQTTMSVEEAARFVERLAVGDDDAQAARNSERCIRDAGYYRTLYREAAKIAHPDAGGSQQQFVRLQEAKRVLDQHHGLK